MKKRLLFVFLIIIIVPLLILGYARFVEPNLLTVKSFTIQTKKPIQPCTVVFFTDTHFGKYYDVSHARSIVKKINKAQPDIVIFGGDLLDNYARDNGTMDFDYLREELNKIEAKAGKYAVWGNHDYGGGAVRVYKDFMESCGFRILDNESVELENYGIKVIGYDDYLMGWTDPALYQIKSSLFNVIASHEPVVSQFIENAGENLMLSGHTHGGQVSIPFVTADFLPDGSGKFLKGFYTQEEIGTEASLQMYTSSGIGMTRYPLRFLNVPEIIKINLQSQE